MKQLIVCLLLSCLAGRGATAAPPPAVAPFGDVQAKAHQKAWADHLGVPVQTTNSIGMKQNLIPPGEFQMGSPESDRSTATGRSINRRLGENSWSENQHLVRITKPFYLGVYEVTQKQYEQVMGKNPSDRKVANKPVEKVSWNDAVAFCRKLSAQEGVEYRLPTEAEWEYACRAGTTTAYCCGDDARELPQYAWYNKNSKNTTHPIGEKLPNPWDLYDMHGNVWEWCQDWLAAYGNEKVVSDPTGPTHGEYRVLRGGAFFLQPGFVRAAFRNYFYQSAYRLPFYGFRLARTCNVSP